MVSCFLIAWLLLAMVATLIAALAVLTLAIAVTSAMLQIADAILTGLVSALSDGVVLYEVARSLAIGAALGGLLGTVGRAAT